MRNIAIFAIFSLVLLACGQSNNAGNTAVATRMVAPAKISSERAGDAVMGGAEQSMVEATEPNSPPPEELKKYIALRHHLTIELEAEAMQSVFDATLKQCESLHCQILTANVNKGTPYSPPSASLSVRMPPRNVEVFLSGLAKSGEVMQHLREAEDKTNQVVDADARIKNLTELRDRLRTMLNDKSAKFKDVIEVERELANTQSQLDSYLSMRKVLSLETDYVAMNIDFSAKQGITEQGFFAPVAKALKGSGRVMMESLAAVITFVMTALPWLLIGIPLILLARRFWLKIKNKFLPAQ